MTKRYISIEGLLKTQHNRNLTEANQDDQKPQMGE